MIKSWPSLPQSKRIESTRRVAFVSDLHLFSSRSVADLHTGHVEASVQWGDVVVWGGDLFDFRWNRLGTHDQAIPAALDWLTDWCRRYPEKVFVYLSGNHDAESSFVQEITSFATRHENFAGPLDALRINDTLFLHGDVIEGGGTEDGFVHYRTKWSSKPVAGKLHNQAYDAAVSMRLHKSAAGIAHRKKQTCLRLLKWLHRQDSECRQGINRIVFGHTHRRIDGLSVGGVEFYNGGAAIKHVPFEPVEVEFP